MQAYGRPCAADIPQPSPGSPIRLMIVDDSIVARSILARVIEAHPGFTIIASVAGADQALARLATAEVDIILLDVAMPGMDGLTALPELIRSSRGARVLIVSSLADAGAATCLEAMALGAADTLPKPGAGAGGFGGRFAALLVEKLLRIASEPRGAVVEGKDAGARGRGGPVIPLRAPVAGPVDCLAIGASTGGLHALNAFFAALPAEFTAPILVTQHLPPSFMPFFAAQLRAVAKRPVTVAADHVRLRPGELLVAPGDAHLALVRSGSSVHVRLQHGPSPSRCLPSVDPMFEAVAACFGAAALGVVLSGMGRDGLIGAGALVAAGGDVVAQDQASSVVWGMPGAVATAGLASLVAAPGALARSVMTRAQTSAANGPSRWR